MPAVPEKHAQTVVLQSTHKKCAENVDAGLTHDVDVGLTHDVEGGWTAGRGPLGVHCLTLVITSGMATHLEEREREKLKHCFVSNHLLQNQGLGAHHDTSPLVLGQFSAL